MAAHGANNVQAALALLTGLTPQQIEKQSAAGGTTFPVNRPLPSHLKPCGKNDELAKCQGCNNPWPRDKAIPCYHECKFVEHPDYNHECKEKPFPKRGQLSWRDFREKHAGVTPPAAFLTWEQRDKEYKAKQAKYGNNKRPREDGKSTSKQP